MTSTRRPEEHLSPSPESEPTYSVSDAADAAAIPRNVSSMSPTLTESRSSSASSAQRRAAPGPGPGGPVVQGNGQLPRSTSTSSMPTTMLTNPTGAGAGVGASHRSAEERPFPTPYIEASLPPASGRVGGGPNASATDFRPISNTVAASSQSSVAPSGSRPAGGGGTTAETSTPTSRHSNKHVSKGYVLRHSVGTGGNAVEPSSTVARSVEGGDISPEPESSVEKLGSSTKETATSDQPQGVKHSPTGTLPPPSTTTALPDQPKLIPHTVMSNPNPSQSVLYRANTQPLLPTSGSGRSSQISGKSAEVGGAVNKNDSTGGGTVVVMRRGSVAVSGAIKPALAASPQPTETSPRRKRNARWISSGSTYPGAAIQQVLVELREGRAAVANRNVRDESHAGVLLTTADNDATATSTVTSTESHLDSPLQSSQLNPLSPCCASILEGFTKKFDALRLEFNIIT